MIRRSKQIRVPPECSVLFVCLGNICRSPTAEAVFRATAERAGILSALDVDSAGIGDWHVGQPPDRRAIATAHRRGYDLTRLRGRQVTAEDFDRFHWIFAMDQPNLRALEALRPATYAGHLGLFLGMAPGPAVREVPDPYYGGAEGFDHVLDLIEEASEALVAQLRTRIPPW